MNLFWLDTDPVLAAQAHQRPHAQRYLDPRQMDTAQPAGMVLNMPETHKIELYYTTDDDGIHLLCRCGWRHRAGYFPTPEQAMKLADAHYEAVGEHERPSP